jgi:putative tryptophan/tyrosine transport system substrate-binding protein
MRRREFIILLGGAATAWPLAAQAQQPAIPVIGTLFGASAAEWKDVMAGFHRGLGATGFVEGRNLAIEYRWGDGQFDRMPAMAADLVSRNVAAILVGGSVPGVRAVIAATRTIPIVFTTGSDPVANGLVASLNRPGGNATGVTFIGGQLVPKKLELLHEAIPTATKIVLLVNPNNPVTLQEATLGAQAATRRLGLDVILLNARTDNEIETAFATAVQQGAGAVTLGNDAYISSRRELIAALALRHALPTMTEERQAVIAGMLMSYGANIADMYRQAGIYVARILKGEKPADLPVMQPTRFELIVNVKTAKAIGLTIPETFLVRADEVIE